MHQLFCKQNVSGANLEPLSPAPTKTTSEQRPTVNYDQQPPISGPKCHKNMSTFVHFGRLCNENLDLKKLNQI